MENNAILDSQLLASSQADPLCGVEQSRLNKPYAQGISQGAWCAKASSTDPNPWMQVGFLWPAAVTGILTQGRSVQHDQWATSFKFSSSNDFLRYESYMSAAGSTVSKRLSILHCVVNKVKLPLISAFAKHGIAGNRGNSEINVLSRKPSNIPPPPNQTVW